MKASALPPAAVLIAAAGAVCGGAAYEAEMRVPLARGMVASSAPVADFTGLVDEQDVVGDPPSGKPAHGWEIPSQHWKRFPYAATIDLGRVRTLSAVWVYDTNGTGTAVFFAGEPGNWREVARHGFDKYLQWVRLPLDTPTRHVRIELEAPGANFAEIALYEHTPEAYRALLARKAAEERARKAREAALARARDEKARRPWIELAPFGRVRVVDEVDLVRPDARHMFRESPAGASRAATILGMPCRVLDPVEGECAYMAFRIGAWKLLEPGARYILAIDYPEDAPRSIIVMNGGSEAVRGFHTGTTVGDALHAKYVDSNPESLDVPLSGRIETWTLYFNLHDRFPDLRFVRGAKERPLLPEDGFDVAVAQFSARNDPTSAGAAVARIRLLEAPDETALAVPLRYPPAPLPRRCIFWREEMADGVIQSDKETERGVRDRLAWYRFKAGQMRLLGMNAFAKDLLEFGACQHWDSTPYGGNAWVHFAWGARDLWPRIAALLGERGLSVLPYYEYAGSKGDRGLGYQRRAKPLTRDDAYTHISWVETANADITDPDTYADFKKMLDLTVLKIKDAVRVEGIWIRPRWQLPMSFADATRERFARDANGGTAVARADLAADKALLARYEEWWYAERREFLCAMRDHLRANGIPEAVVLFTAEGGEPGTRFPTWERRIVTDGVETWRRILAGAAHVVDGRAMAPVDIERVVGEGLYLRALTAAPLNWGGWEVDHANPPADPARYAGTPGVLMTHCVNRAYTAASPATFDAFRGPSGLALARHYALNEHMMFDAGDGEKLGYFVADIERAGPYCMLAEALAVANGDPTLLGYLLGGNVGRGFPAYVRDFNANFLALPALPSERLADACDDRDVVVRAIRTPEHGTYFAVVNIGFGAKSPARIRLPVRGAVRSAVSGAALPAPDGVAALYLRPCQLHALHAGG